tara:strand:+ start:8569 stop:8829 length:261 start_codon:yes stop_codon:yes gene_type:complete
MSRIYRHIEQSNINYEEPYAIFTRPTNATFISTETMETNEEKTSVRQESEIVYAQSTLAENKKAEGQTQTTSVVEIMESKTVGFLT